jgi:hypothetical protein
MPNLKGMNVEALMKLRNQVDERHLSVAIGVGGAIALAIIGYLLHWIVSGVVRPQPCLPPTRRRTAVARRSDPWDDARRSWRARRAGRLAD